MITSDEVFEFFALHFGYEIDAFKVRSQKQLITSQKRTAYLVSYELLGKAMTISSLAKSFGATDGTIYESMRIGKGLLSVNDTLLTPMYKKAKRAFTLHLIEKLQNTL